MSEKENKSGKKEPSEIDRPNFDIVFQMGILKMSMQDDYFCAQLVKYLAEDNDLEQYTIFDNEGLQTLFKIIVDSVHNFKNRPTEGQVRQKFNEYPDQERDDYNELLDTIFAQDTHNEEYYRQYLQTYVQQVKMAKGFKKTKKIWREHPESAPEFMQQVIDSIRRVSFEKEDVITLNDLPGLLTEGSALNSRKIPTGIKELDIDLVGGLPRENLSVILAGTNVGKSLFCISLACNALKAVDENGKDLGLKVLHINLEGERGEAIKRYAANLAAINYSDLLRGTFDPDARQRLNNILNQFDESRLKIRNMLGFGATIEEMIAYLKEEYKNFKFDILVVDYGQLLESKIKSEGYRFTMSRVFRGLDSASKEFSCVVMTPAQATRGAQASQNMTTTKKFGGQQDERAYVMRSTDIAEAMEISRVAGVILTLNRTEEEEKTNRLRLFLEKQRQGAKNKLYGLFTNYSQSNLITGKTYNPFEAVIDGPNEVKLEKKPEVTGSLKDIKHITENKQKNIKVIKEEPVEELNPSIKLIDNLTNDYHLAREDFSRAKAHYDQLRDTGDYDVEEADELFALLDKLKTKMIDILQEARLMIGQAYPDANKDQYDMIKSQLSDLRKNAGDEKKIKELEQIIRHYEVGLQIVKVPS